MDNSEFDKFFEKKMKGVAAPEYSETEWNALVARLNNNHPKSGLKGMNRLGLVLGFLLLLSNLFWGWAWYRTQKTVNSLSKGITKEAKDSIINTQHTTVISADTIFRTVIVHRYDTSHHYINYLASISPSLTATKTHTDKGNILNPSSSDGLSVISNEFTQLLTSGFKLPKGEVPPSVTHSKSDIVSLLVQKNNSIQHKDNKKPTFENIFVQKTFDHKNNTSILDQLMPKRFSIGALYGLHYLLNETLQNNRGNAFGFVAAIGFNKHLDITLQGMRSQHEYFGKKYDRTLGLPSLIPPTEEYEFRYFKLEDQKLSIYQFGLGLKYGFLPDSKFNPTIGIAYVNQWLGKHEIEIEYKHKINDDRYEDYFEIETQKSPNGFLEIQGGLQFNKSKNWKYQAIGYYQNKVNSATIGVKENWGLRGCLIYQF